MSRVNPILIDCEFDILVITFRTSGFAHPKITDLSVLRSNKGVTNVHMALRK